jgi:curved DNA-binding protein CbpA
VSVNHRRENRVLRVTAGCIKWSDSHGLTHSAKATILNESSRGLAVECEVPLQKNTAVYIEAQRGYPKGYAVVRHCTQTAVTVVLGLELQAAAATNGQSAAPSDRPDDYYEFLQVSPNANDEVIQRIYHFLARRYHPDNGETGDPEKFRFLNEAYRTLSNPEHRTRYDARFRKISDAARPLAQCVDFLHGVEGEVNRRLAVLAILYTNCRLDVQHPHVSLRELEAQMGCPREYLDFAIWYLRSKKYIRQEDNAQLALTALGVDYIEENYASQPLLRTLLEAKSHAVSYSRNISDSLQDKTGNDAYLLNSSGSIEENSMSKLPS